MAMPVLHGDELTLPHPRAHLRAFVLLPLAEIDPAAEPAGPGADRALAAARGRAGHREASTLADGAHRSTGPPTIAPPRARTGVQRGDNEHVLRQTAAARGQLLRAVRPACGLHHAGGARLHAADPELRRRRRCASEYAAEVDAAERAADRVTAEVNRLLHKTFITPIDREQIHGLINAHGRHRRPAAGRHRDDVAVRRAQAHRGRAAPGRDQRQVLRAGAARGVAACPS